MRLSLVALLLLSTSGAIAESWQCHGSISHGAESKSEASIALEFDGEKVTLTAPDYTYTTGKLDTKKQVSVYAKQEASDLSNERITTSRMFRFDHANGHLVFFDHTANHLLITANCSTSVIPEVTRTLPILVIPDTAKRRSGTHQYG